MTLRVWNSMTRKKEEFVPLKPGKVGMYVCGVTTYDLCHVGHARVYVVFDTILRWLRREFQVTYVRNFTDVDDKIIKRANEAGEDPIQLAARFCDEFHVDMDALGVLRPEIEPRVSTHMNEIVSFVDDLVAKGWAYRARSESSVEGAGDDVFFRVKRFNDAFNGRYYELSHRVPEEPSEAMPASDQLAKGQRVATDERKEDKADFALWKSAKPGEPSWPSPFGKGRPGWHIECSAMSEKHLGATFDIHGGGKDLIFPHHTNEIAQSEARHDHAVMAKYWLHNGFVSIEAGDDDAPDDLVEEIVDDKGKKVKVVKMSKSLGNFFTLREVFKQFTPESIRMLLLGTQYRGPIAYSPRLVDESEKRLQKLYEARRRMAQHIAKTPPEDGPSLEHIFSKPGEPFLPMKAFTAGMEDDFNTPEAMAALYSLIHVANLLVDGKEKEITGTKLKPAQRSCLLREATNIIDQMCAVLGVGQRDPVPFLEEQRALRLSQKVADGVPFVRRMLEERAEAKKAKDYPRADATRRGLEELGLEVRDTPEGTVEWSVSDGLLPAAAPPKLDVVVRAQGDGDVVFDVVSIPEADGDKSETVLTTRIAAGAADALRASTGLTNEQLLRTLRPSLEKAARTSGPFIETAPPGRDHGNPARFAAWYAVRVGGNLGVGGVWYDAASDETGPAEAPWQARNHLRFAVRRNSAK